MASSSNPNLNDIAGNIQPIKKIITIIKNLTKSLGTIISVVKGHQKSDEKSNILILWEEVKKSLVPILTPVMIRDVFTGKDLMQLWIRKM